MYTALIDIPIQLVAAMLFILIVFGPDKLERIGKWLRGWIR